ncbi:MAG: glycosyltransferase [Candidatus Aminicenantes bacterium]|nr:glycosyltransferase [Candidatus Aminicenantes bacterium]
MKKKPLLSVIVANYNNAVYIKECFDSILKQSFKDLEIVLFDDCSTDDSPGIIKEYEKKHPAVVRAVFSRKNIGVAAARHEAIRQAQGEYITTLDSDDYYYDQQKLAKEMEVISRCKKNENKDVIAFSNIVMVKGDGTVMRFLGTPKNIKEGNILAGIITRSCMIPRDFVQKKDAYFAIGGYDSRFPIYEDWDLKLRLAAKYEYYYTGINGTCYRRHGAGLSSWPVPQHIKWMKKIFKKNLPLIDRSVRKEAKTEFKVFLNKIKDNYKKKKK